jgi:hypothetical protein
MLKLQNRLLYSCRGVVMTVMVCVQEIGHQTFSLTRNVRGGLLTK